MRDIGIQRMREFDEMIFNAPTPQRARTLQFFKHGRAVFEKMYYPEEPPEPPSSPRK